MDCALPAAVLTLTRQIFRQTTPFPENVFSTGNRAPDCNKLRLQEIYACWEHIGKLMQRAIPPIGLKAFQGEVLCEWCGGARILQTDGKTHTLLKRLTTFSYKCRSTFKHASFSYSSQSLEKAISSSIPRRIGI